MNGRKLVAYEFVLGVETYNSNINVHSWLKDETGNHGPRPWIETRNCNTDVNKHKAYGCAEYSLIKNKTWYNG